MNKRYKVCDYKWVDFLRNYNVIKVSSKEEFNAFKSFLEKLGLIEILQENIEFSDWQRLAVINNKNPDIFLFEYDNSKGLTWSDDIEKTKQWYGDEPISIVELYDNSEKNNDENSIKVDRKKRLCDFVELEENNRECVVLRVKEDSRMQLINLGYFKGNEELIRVSKGRDNTYTIFYKDGTTFSWHYGESGYTLVTDSLDKERILINECVQNDFDIYIGRNEELREKSLDIHCLEDTYSKVNEIKMMYWKGNENGRVTVHKNGEFFKYFDGINGAKEYFKNTGHILSYRDEYVAKTGCIVEEYSMVKEQYYEHNREENKEKKDSDFDYDY